MDLVTIEKPGLKYNTNGFPDKLNIIFLGNEDKEKQRNVLNGIISNYYFYKNASDYAPELRIVNLTNLEKPNKCKVEDTDSFSIVLILDKSITNSSAKCIKKLSGLIGLLVSTETSNQIERTNLKTIYINRNDDIINLLAYANKNDKKNTLIIDDAITRDRLFIEEYWKQIGGTTIKSTTINESTRNEDLLSEILLIKESNNRARRLSRAISLPVKHVPRRRGDIDSIFLSVDLLQARTLKPAIDYNFAESIEVYVIPNWESEEIFYELERDLEDTLIIDMPFMLNAYVPFIDLELVKRNRYFAIGNDAFELALLLNSKKKNKAEFIGMTGRIFIRPNGQLSRKSLKVKIIDGKLTSLSF